MKLVAKNSFEEFPLSNAKNIASFIEQFPTLLHAWSEKGLIFEQKNSSLIGFVYEGEAEIESADFCYTLKAGMYFSIPLNAFEAIRISGGKGFIAERLGYESFLTFGGPVEQTGRLKYIDGCTDSLLVPPVKFGDACLNLLYFPPDINQTAHTHPSVRLGMIIKGKGECITPQGIIPLRAGQLFAIHTDGVHAFRTTSQSSMTVIAYHPDSDFGPQDENHPMVNRTIVNGVSANQIDEIRTK